METDLSSVIKSPQHLSEAHIQFFLYQILRGVLFLHTSNVIHRDLKPRNLLVNSNCDLKICDFGLSRIDYPNMKWKTIAMTDYIATRWYRAPEVIVGWSEYTKSVDIWSIGTILAELLLRRPLFGGCDNQEQLDLITGVLGSPDRKLIKRAKKLAMKNHLEGMSPGEAGTGFRPLIPTSSATPDVVSSMLSKMLTFDPADRWSVRQLLRHPYLESLQCDSDEPEGGRLPKRAFQFEHAGATPNRLREEILEEMLWYNNENLDYLAGGGGGGGGGVGGGRGG